MKYDLANIDSTLHFNHLISIISFHSTHFISFTMVDEDDVDLHPVSTRVQVVKKRPREVQTAPDNGPLIITINTIVLKGGTQTFTKSRFSRDIKIPDAISLITDPTKAIPTILSGELHKAIVKYFGEMAATTIAIIMSGSGEITEHSLVGDSQAEYKVNIICTFHVFT